ncbi:MAG: hypothetical protein J2P22_17505 [Nocardioides sp.]|nr:hypothetical protein [Nocardioides sp.]
MTQPAMAPVPLPWGTTRTGELTRKGTILGAVMGTLAVFTTLPLGITGIVLSCKGLDRVHRGDPSARKFLTWSWICFVPGTVIGAALIVYGALSLVG